MVTKWHIILIRTAWVWLLLALAGCGSKTVLSSTVIPTNTIPPTPSVPTPEPSPTPTSEPLAALVNGESITLAEFQAELERYQRAKAELSSSNSGTNLATEEGEDEMIVLQDLIDQTLLAQAAVQAGHPFDSVLLEERFNQLAAQTDLPDWLGVNGYTESSFRVALGRALQAAWMRDQILAAAPTTAEQVHARQILLYNLDNANQVYANLQSGADFKELAAQVDPISAGDLGWFPRGYLLESTLEEAAFSLQPGQYSQVIETRLGFHIIQVIERDPQRPLAADAQRLVQEQALQSWLADRRSQSTIQIMLN